MNDIAEKISAGRRQGGRSYIMRSIEGAKPGLGTVHSVAKCLFIFIGIKSTLVYCLQY